MATRLMKYLVLVCVSLVLAGCSESIDDLLTNAEEQRADGRYQAAQVYYRSVLEREPDHAEARFGLGETALRTGDYSGAETAFRRAERQGITADRLQPALGRALLWQGKYEEVLEEIEPVSVDGGAARADILALRSIAYLQLGQISDARSTAREAGEIDDTNPLVQIAGGRVALQMGDLEKALQAADRTLELSPDSAGGWLLRANISRQEGDSEGAIDALRRLMDLMPNDISGQEHFFARGQLVELLLAAGQQNEAQAQVDLMLEQGSRHPYPNFLAAFLAYQDDDIRTATDHLQVVLSGAPDSVQAKELMGLVRLRREQHVQAAAVLREVVSAQPENVRARILLATAQRGMDQEAQATRTLRDGLEHANGDPQAIQALTEALESDGEEFARFLQQPNDPQQTVRPSRLTSGESLVGRGETGAAVDLLHELETADDDELTRRQFRAIAAIQSGDTDGALSEARAIVEDYPDDAASYNLLGGIELIARRFDDARESFERALELDETSAQARFNLGLLAGVRQDFDTAINHFESGLEIDPENAAVMVQLADVLRRQGRNDEALEWAERAVLAAPDDPGTLMVLARQQLVMGDAAGAVSSAEQAVRQVPDNGAAHGILGVALLESGDAETALESLRTAHEQLPDDADIQFHLARAQAAVEDLEGTRATLNRLLDQQPDRLDAVLALTRLDLREERADQALDGALRLQEASATHSEGLLLEGHARNLRGDREGAVRAYQAAVDEGRIEAMGPLINTREALGEDAPAQPMEDWIVENPDNAQARFSLANWYIERQSYDAAIAHYETLVEITDEGNASVFNNLAWLYQQTGDDRALETAQRAHRLAPDNPDILDTLGRIHYERGNYAEARPLLTQATEAAPDNATIRYHYGAALIASGEQVAGEQAIQEALDMNPDADWAEDARRLLGDG